MTLRIDKNNAWQNQAAMMKPSPWQRYTLYAVLVFALVFYVAEMTTVCESRIRLVAQALEDSSKAVLQMSFLTAAAIIPIVLVLLKWWRKAILWPFLLLWIFTCSELVQEVITRTNWRHVLTVTVHVGPDQVNKIHELADLCGVHLAHYNLSIYVSNANTVSTATFLALCRQNGLEVD